MGWIHDRHMKRGGSLYSGGPKKKGPLRKIVSVLIPRGGLFAPAVVRLECGHKTTAWGDVRAICATCRE